MPPSSLNNIKLVWIFLQDWTENLVGFVDSANTTSRITSYSPGWVYIHKISKNNFGVGQPEF